MPKMMAIVLALFCTIAGAHFTSQALAQQKPVFGLGAAPASQGQVSPAPYRTGQSQGVVDRIWLWVLEGQRALTSGMTNAVRQLKSGNLVTSSAILAAISFIYGILHAVGHGHGKFVISSYALANDRTVRRGILLSFMAALIQALSAIVIVGALIIVLRATSLELRLTEAWLETASWGLIALFGAWLLLGQLRRIWWPGRAAQAAGHDHAHHGHDRAHHHDHARGHVQDDHAHDNTHDASCGHAHVATPAQLGGQWSWPKAWSLAFSIGIRPCTGALAVLVFAFSINLFWAGIFATVAMAFGTAITVSTLAALAVGSRELARRLSGSDSPWGPRIESAAGVLGSVLIMLMGATFFLASLHGAAPL